MRKSLIKKILLGKKHIYEYYQDKKYIHNSNVSLAYYNGWYFQNDEKYFYLKDYKKKWWVK